MKFVRMDKGGFSTLYEIVCSPSERYITSAHLFPLRDFSVTLCCCLIHQHASHLEVVRTVTALADEMCLLFPLGVGWTGEGRRYSNGKPLSDKAQRQVLKRVSKESTELFMCKPLKDKE